MNSNSSPHVLVFPFMSKGHMIPFIHLARLLLRRNITVTFITTPANRPFISASISTSIIELPFPENIPGIPAGVENTDKLASQSLLAPFANATKLMQPHFEKALENLLPVNFMISDGFLGWTLSSASKFNIPRLATYGTNKYSMTLSGDMSINNGFSSTNNSIGDDELIPVPSFPWIKVTKNDFDTRISDHDPSGANLEFITDLLETTAKSYGLLVNTFYELESVFVDHWNKERKPKAFCIGPLCLVQEPKLEIKTKPKWWINWLNQKLNEKKPVLYVAFGSQATVSLAQFKEIALGLEKSNVNFLWVVREKDCELENEYEERIEERGIIIREWVDQEEILRHESVKGFLSHCGWNSCLESICACVPILTWPMMNDQHLNARMVVEEIKVGLRVETCDGSVRGFVKWEGLVRSVRELMEGEKGKEVRENVVVVGRNAKRAMDEGGSSKIMLDKLISELCKQ